MMRLTNILAGFKAFFIRLVSKRYTEMEVDKMLTRQREICCKKMDNWCEHNGIRKCGHIVLYAPRP